MPPFGKFTAGTAAMLGTPWAFLASALLVLRGERSQGGKLDDRAAWRCIWTTGDCVCGAAAAC